MIEEWQHLHKAQARVEAAERQVVGLVDALDLAAQFFRNAGFDKTAIYVERDRDKALGVAAVRG
jgi:hypothetical protein